FLHLSDEFKKGSLAVGVEQFSNLFPDGATKWFSENRLNVLLSHHPREWLSPSAIDEFTSEIAPAGRFAVHLFGHLHEPAAKSIGVGGGEIVRQLQGPSLFSIEKLRRGKGGKTDRIHGYAAGRFTLDPDPQIELWPRRSYRIQDGRLLLAPDSSFRLDRSTLSFRDPPRAYAAHRRPRAYPDAVAEFSSDGLERRMQQWRHVRMLLLRNSRWFKQQAEKLRQRITGATLELEVLLPDPSNRTLMAQLRPMFNIEADALASSVRGVIGQLLAIRASLPEEAKG